MRIIIPCIFLAATLISPGRLTALDDSKRAASYNAEMTRIYKSLSVTPLVLDKNTVNSGEVLKGASSLHVAPGSNFVVPPALGTSEDSILGYEDWFIRRVDGPKKETRSRRHGLIVRKRELVGGDELKLDFWAGEVDPKAENLMSGKYELTVEFTGTNRKVIGSSSAVFLVNNPDYLDPADLAKQRKRRQDKLALHAKQIFGSLQMKEIVIESETVKRGTSVKVGGGLLNTSKSDIILPDDDETFDHVGRRGNTDKNSAIIGWYQWTVSRAGGGENQGAGGSVFTMPDGAVFPSGHNMEIDNFVATKDLKSGQYEVQLTITDCSGKLFGVKKKKFKVIN